MSKTKFLRLNLILNKLLQFLTIWLVSSKFDQKSKTFQPVLSTLKYFSNIFNVVEFRLKEPYYDIYLNPVDWFFVVADFAWKKNKTHANIKFLPIFNCRNKKDVCLVQTFSSDSENFRLGKLAAIQKKCFKIS